MAETIEKASDTAPKPRAAPSAVQKRYLERGLKEPGGKLPLFDRDGQRIKDATIRSCLKNGWCEPWFNNPIKPDWVVCKLTENGRRLFKNKKG